MNSGLKKEEGRGPLEDVRDNKKNPIYVRSDILIYGILPKGTSPVIKRVRRLHRGNGCYLYREVKTPPAAARMRSLPPTRGIVPSWLAELPQKMPVGGCWPRLGRRQEHLAGGNYKMPTMRLRAGR
jgi:hypothetical protein